MSDIPVYLTLGAKLSCLDSHKGVSYSGGSHKGGGGEKEYSWKANILDCRDALCTGFKTDLLQARLAWHLIYAVSQQNRVGNIQ